MSTISGDFKEFVEEKSSARVFARSFVENIHEALLAITINFEIVSGNSSFYALFGIKEEDAQNSSFLELGNNYFSQFQNIKEQLSKQNGKIKDLEFFPEKPPQGKFLVNASFLNGDHPGEELILMSFREKEEVFQERDHKNHFLKSFQDILSKVPASICTVRGPDHIFEVANENYFQLIGKRDIIGKSIREVLPEVEHQGFFEIIDEVYRSGEPFIGKELPIKLNIGEEEPKNSFLDFVYQPTFDATGNVDGIFVHAIDVTEKVVARNKLEESENSLRNLIDAVPAMIWIGDKNGQSTYLNKNWHEYTGQTKEEAKGLGWMEAVHPEDREETKIICWEAIANQKDLMVSFRVRDKNGNYRWAVNRGKAKFNVSGEYEGMTGTVVDVHEEKMKEQLIREKEHRIRSIVQEATVATAVYTGPELCIELANDAMIELWGKNRSVIGKKLEVALPELEGQPFLPILKNVYVTGNTYWGKEDKVQLFRGNKLEEGFYTFTYKPLRDEKGEIYGILNTAINVTKMVKSRLLLTESEAHFRQMADLMPEKVVNSDPEGKPIYFNQNWLDYTGQSSEELKAQGWTKFIHPEDKNRFEKRWQQSLTSGKNFEMELRCLNKSGKYKWHLSRAAAVRQEDGRIKMWIGTNTEIQRLKEEEKRKENFLKMVSHELKTPITSIKGYVQLLLSLLKNEEGISSSGLPLKPSLERINHQVTRLTRLISEMLDISRIEENKLELQKENFSLNDLVAETVQDINYTNTQHNIVVCHTFKGNVFADRDRIGQVLINLITNAIKYSPDSQKVEIKIQKAGNNKVAVSIKDEGIGIEKKNHKNIFKRFYRIGGKGEETYSGFGIGLFLSNEITERHDGSITVKSKKGKGSEFIFTLPVAQN